MKRKPIKSIGVLLLAASIVMAVTGNAVAGETFDYKHSFDKTSFIEIAPKAAELAGTVSVENRIEAVEAILKAVYERNERALVSSAATIAKRYPEISPQIAAIAATIDSSVTVAVAQACAAVAPDFAIEITSAVTEVHPKSSLKVTNAVARVLPHDSDYKLTVLVLSPEPRYLEVPVSAVTLGPIGTRDSVTIRSVDFGSIGGGAVIFKIGSLAPGVKKKFTQVQLTENKETIVQDHPDIFKVEKVGDFSVLRVKDSGDAIISDSDNEQLPDNATNEQLTDLGLKTETITLLDADNQEVVIRFLSDTTTGGNAKLPNAVAKQIEELTVANPTANLVTVNQIGGVNTQTETDADGNTKVILVGSSGETVVQSDVELTEDDTKAGSDEEGRGTGNYARP
jgi:hypothetical protein